MGNLWTKPTVNQNKRSSLNYWNYLKGTGSHVVTVKLVIMVDYGPFMKHRLHNELNFHYPLDTDDKWDDFVKDYNTSYYNADQQNFFNITAMITPKNLTSSSISILSECPELLHRLLEYAFMDCTRLDYFRCNLSECYVPDITIASDKISYKVKEGVNRCIAFKAPKKNFKAFKAAGCIP